MSQIIRAIVITGILIAAVQAQPQEPAKPASQKSTVVIDSRPDHAEIRLNGKFVGTTPMTYNLTAGEHRIELARLGYGSWTRELTVLPSAPARVVAILEPAQKQADCTPESK